MTTRRRFMAVLFAALAVFTITVSASAHAAEEVVLRIKDHRFIPETLEIPANTKVKIVVHNEDPTPEEFESHELNREKIIRGNGKGVVFVGPLDAGSYPFFGEFNEDTAQGQLLVK